MKNAFFSSFPCLTFSEEIQSTQCARLVYSLLMLMHLPLAILVEVRALVACFQTATASVTYDPNNFAIGVEYPFTEWCLNLSRQGNDNHTPTTDSNLIVWFVAKSKLKKCKRVSVKFLLTYIHPSVVFAVPTKLLQFSGRCRTLHLKGT